MRAQSWSDRVAAGRWDVGAGGTPAREGSRLQEPGQLLAKRAQGRFDQEAGWCDVQAAEEDSCRHQPRPRIPVAVSLSDIRLYFEVSFDVFDIPGRPRLALWQQYQARGQVDLTAEPLPPVPRIGRHFGQETSQVGWLTCGQWVGDLL